MRPLTEHQIATLCAALNEHRRGAMKPADPRQYAAWVQRETNPGVTAAGFHNLVIEALGPAYPLDKGPFPTLTDRLHEMMCSRLFGEIPKYPFSTLDTLTAKARNALACVLCHLLESDEGAGTVGEECGDQSEDVVAALWNTLMTHGVWHPFTDCKAHAEAMVAGWKAEAARLNARSEGRRTT